MKSTQLEVFKQTVSHQRPDRILYKATFIQELDRKVHEVLRLDPSINLVEYFGMLNPQEISMKQPENWVKADFSRYFREVNIASDAFINHLGVLETPGGFHHFTHYTSPLRNAESMKDLEDFPYPSVNGYLSDHMKAEVDLAHSKGRVTMLCIGHMYEDGWQIRGYEPFLMDMYEQPEWCEYILDRLVERNLIKATAAARAGVDYLVTGDDIANQKDMMFSVECWRKFMKPRWAKVYAAARAIKPDIQIWYHSDGNMEGVIPELIEIGVNILNPIQPECLDPVKIKKKFGNQLTLDGGIGTQTTMPFGTPSEVRQTVKNAIENLGRDGGFILSPTHVLEPEVPVENIVAFVESAQEFGG